MYGEHRKGGFRSHGGGMGMSPPVKVGDEMEVTIEAVGEKGDGLAKKNGFVLFIPGVKEGQQVRVRVTKVLRKVGFAEVISSEGGQAEAPTEGAPETEEYGSEEEAPAEEAPAESEDFGEEAPAEETPAESEDFGEEAPAEETPAESEEDQQ